MKSSKLMESRKEAGNLAFKENDYLKAMAIYSEVLDMDPSNVSFNSKMYSNRSTCLSKLGKYEEAILDCNKALEADENFLKVYLRRADCFMKLEKYEEAIRDYEKSKSLSPQNRGDAYLYF